MSLTVSDLDIAQDNAERWDAVINGPAGQQVALRDNSNVDTLRTILSVFKTYNIRDAWMTASVYFAKDLVEESGSWYIVLEDHTSGVFATDLANGKLQLYQPDFSSALTLLNDLIVNGNILFDGGLINSIGKLASPINIVFDDGATITGITINSPDRIVLDALSVYINSALSFEPKISALTTTGNRSLIYATDSSFPNGGLGSLVLQSRPDMSRPIIFSVGGIETGRFSSSGNFGVGDTAPSDLITARGAADSTISVERTGGAKSITKSFATQGQTGTVSAHPFRIITDENIVAHFSVNGDMGLGTIAPTFTSGNGLHIEYAGASNLKLSNTATAKSSEITQATDLQINTTQAGSDVVLSSNWVNGLKVKETGDVEVVNSLSVGKATADYPLDVLGDSRIGWHGFSDKIKITPADFISNDDSTNTLRIVEDGGGAPLGLGIASGVLEIYAMVQIPKGYKIDAVRVYASATINVEIYEGFVDAPASALLYSGDTTASIPLTVPMAATATNYIIIKVLTTATTDVVYGGLLDISPI